MTWNYRVIKRVIGGEDSYGIHEVYYNDDGTIRAWSENPIIPTGETPEELKKDFLIQRHALDNPILNYDELVKNVQNG